MAELVENCIDARAKTIVITRGKDKGQHYLRVKDDGEGVRRNADGEPDFHYVATHVCDSIKRRLKTQGTQGLQGEFGIGLLSFWTLGEDLLLTSAGDDGRARQMHLRKGDPSYRITLRPALFPEPGTEVLIRGILPGIKNFSGEKIQWYLASELRDRIRHSGVAIRVVDRTARAEFKVEPRQFEGRLLHELQNTLPKQSEVYAELYLHTHAPANAVSLYRSGTRVLENIAEIEAFARPPWTSGYVQGIVDAPYLNDVPSTLNDWKSVWAFEGSRPVVAGGVRYVAMGGQLEATDPLSGERLWARSDATAKGTRALGTVALAGPANTATAARHRRSAQVFEGTPRIAQRYAIDWVRLGDNGQTYQGDRRKNRSYYSYGAEVLAVANGVVVEVKDGIPENTPPADSKDGTPPAVSLAVEITMETVAGNHVNLDLGGGVYAMYAHLQPGSIRVKLGDKVTPGQVIGLLGNSGHAGEPHLHFQLMDRNSPLNSEGLPYYFPGFKLAARISGDSEGQVTEAPAHLKVNRLPAPEAHHIYSRARSFSLRPTLRHEGSWIRKLRL